MTDKPGEFDWRYWLDRGAYWYSFEATQKVADRIKELEAENAALKKVNIELSESITIVNDFIEAMIPKPNQKEK